MEKKKKSFHFPIRFKTATIIVVFGLVLAEIAMIYFSLGVSNDNKKSYKNMATDLANTVALSVDNQKVKSVKDQVLSYYDETKPGREEQGTPEYEEYMAQFDAVRANADYQAIQSYLAAVKAANRDTDAVYLGYVDSQAKKCVYLVYDSENEDFPVGIIDPLYEEDYPLVEDPMIGFRASIYKDLATGATLVTAGAPILDQENPTTADGKPNVMCYALVDISMTTVRAGQANRIIRLFLYLMFTVAVLLVIGIIVIHFIIIKPLKTLTDAAKSYDVEHPEKTHAIFSNLNVKVHDELSDLADSMKRMEADVNAKIHELTEANAALSASKKVAGKMAELANKDALTGVKNKIAYDNKMANLDEKIKKGEEVSFGIAMVDLNYLKNINDDYGHDSGDRALVKLCGVICATFAHSPVYRIGGDEFVIVLQGEDHENAASLIKGFEHQIATLSGEEDALPEEQVSAAIGYAEYDPDNDACVDDVFKRADQLMYARKREMKGQ